MTADTASVCSEWAWKLREHLGNDLTCVKKAVHVITSKFDVLLEQKVKHMI